MRELPSEVGLDVDVDVDNESAIADVEGPDDILVIPKCAANPRARAGDALRDAEEPLLVDAEPAVAGTAGADGLGIVIGGVEAETRRCHRGGVNGLSSILRDVLGPAPVVTDST